MSKSRDKFTYIDPLPEKPSYSDMGDFLVKCIQSVENGGTPLMMTTPENGVRQTCFDYFIAHANNFNEDSKQNRAYVTQNMYTGTTKSLKEKLNRMTVTINIRALLDLFYNTPTIDTNGKFCTNEKGDFISCNNKIIDALLFENQWTRQGTPLTSMFFGDKHEFDVDFTKLKCQNDNGKTISCFERIFEVIDRVDTLGSEEATAFKYPNLRALIDNKNNNYKLNRCTVNGDKTSCMNVVINYAEHLPADIAKSMLLINESIADTFLHRPSPLFVNDAGEPITGLEWVMETYTDADKPYVASSGIKWKEQACHDPTGRPITCIEKTIDILQNGTPEEIERYKGFAKALITHPTVFTWINNETCTADDGTYTTCLEKVYNLSNPDAEFFKEFVFGKNYKTEINYSLHNFLTKDQPADPFIEILWDLFRIFSPTGKEKEVIRYASHYLTNHCGFDHVEIDALGNILATRGVAESYPLLNAHMDTVQKDSDLKNLDALVYNVTTNTFHANDKAMIGCDDKAGIAAILYIALTTTCPLKIALTVAEEIGSIGVNAIPPSFFDDVAWGITLDRKNASDLITKYHDRNLCPKQFAERIIMHAKAEGVDMNVTSGSMADPYDISFYAPCVNMSIGCYYPHTSRDLMRVNEARTIINVVKRCLDDRDTMNRLAALYNEPTILDKRVPSGLKRREYLREFKAATGSTPTTPPPYHRYVTTTGVTSDTTNVTIGGGEDEREADQSRIAMGGKYINIFERKRRAKPKGYGYRRPDNII